MFKYMILLAAALVAVMANPAPAPAEAPKDLQTANQLLYGAYPSVYSAGVYPYGASYYPTAYASPYAAYGYRSVVVG